MSGSVNVTGPPSRIWRRKVGTTLPRLPITLPNRTTAHGSPHSRPTVNTVSSAARLVAPITEHGLTALSVEMRTNRSHPYLAAVLASHHVASRFVSRASTG